jgi:hypothetical protein
MTSTNTYIQSYVVYHITYSGDKLPSKNNSNITPSNYIGSTSIEQINNGYMGSVASKMYKSIWDSELKGNLHLFKIKIISYHDTRPDATHKELQVQKLFNVVKNPLFVNMAYAQPNGYFGMVQKGELKSNKHKENLSKAMSLEWVILDPKNIIYQTKNLKSFCEEHNLNYNSAKTSSKTKIVQRWGKNKNWFFIIKNNLNETIEIKDQLEQIILQDNINIKQYNSNMSKIKKGIPCYQSTKNQLYKKYLLTNPEGVQFCILGLKQFCKENNLTLQGMCAVSKNKQTHHKGWKCSLI